MSRRPIGLVAAALLVLSLAGCLRVDVAATINADSTLDGVLVVAVSHAYADATGLDPDTLVDQLGLGVLSGSTAQDAGSTTVTPFDEGGFVGRRITLTRAPLDALGGDGNLLSIARVAGEFQASGVIDLTEQAVGPLPPAAGTGDDLVVRLSLTFPGDVRSHDGTLSGRTVSWSAGYGERLAYSATGRVSAGGDALPVLVWAGLGLLAVLVAGGAVAVLATRPRLGPHSAEAAPTQPIPVGPERT